MHGEQNIKKKKCTHMLWVVCVLVTVV